MSQVNSVMTHFVRMLRKIQQDPLSPFVLSPEIDGYLNDLTRKHPNENSCFIKFLASLTIEAIRDELTRQISPDSLKQSFLELREQREHFRSVMESAALKKNLDSALHCHGRLKEIEHSIIALVKSNPLLVTPELLAVVLENLGYKD